MPDTPELLDKHQAAKRLGLHWRSVLLFAKQDKLASTSVRDPKTNQITTKFPAEAVERLRKERAAPPAIDVGERAVKSETRVALQRLQPRTEANMGLLLAALAERMETPAAKPFLTLEEAAKYSGLPVRGIHELVSAGKVPVLDFGRGTRGGRYRIKRTDLDALEGGVIQSAMAAG